MNEVCQEKIGKHSYDFMLKHLRMLLERRHLKLGLHVILFTSHDGAVSSCKHGSYCKEVFFSGQTSTNLKTSGAPWW